VCAAWPVGVRWYESGKKGEKGLYDEYGLRVYEGSYELGDTTVLESKD